MLSKKSVVLSGDKGSQRAVLTMERGEDDVCGRVRLYGFENEPSGILSLGIACDGKVIKAGLTKQNYMLFAFKTQNFDIFGDFSCAVVNFVEGQPSVLLYGSGRDDGVEEGYQKVIESLKQSQNVMEVEKALDDFGVDFEDGLKAEIDAEIDCQMAADEQNAEGSCPQNCRSCVYKHSFYDLQSLSQESAIDEPAIEQKEDKQFYSEIKSQIDSLFEQNETEEFLQNAIPSSKWIRVDLDDGSDYYVFGLIYEGDELKYVCYGVPGLYSALPPKQLSGYPVWFPLDKNKKEGFGYWLTYQDAGSGESVKVIIE